MLVSHLKARLIGTDPSIYVYVTFGSTKYNIDQILLKLLNLFVSKIMKIKPFMMCLVFFKIGITN